MAKAVIKLIPNYRGEPITQLMRNGVMAKAVIKLGAISHHLQYNILSLSDIHQRCRVAFYSQLNMAAPIHLPTITMVTGFYCLSSLKNA